MEKFIIMGAYALMMLFIGLYSMKKANSLTAFVVGGRMAGPWMSAFAYGTTYFSAVIFIGYAGKIGWAFGLFAVLIGFGNAIIGTYLPWKIMAERTRKITREHKIKTMPEFFFRRYNSKGMKIAAAIIIFVFMTPYSASVYSGIGYLSESVLGIDYIWCMIMIAVLTAVYLVMGGYLATLLADFVQGIIMIGGVILMVAKITAAPETGGFFSSISIAMQTTKQNINLFDMSSNNNIITLVSLILLTSLGVWALPQTVHKFYALRGPEVVRPASIISTLFAAIIGGGAYFVGSLSRIFFTDVPTLNGAKNFDLIVPQLLDKLLPDILLALIFVLVLSASMSTLSSIILASTTAISMDLVEDTLLPGITKERTLLLTRILCFIFIGISLGMAVFKSPILQLMSLSWGTIAGSFMGPFILGVMCRRVNTKGAWWGMIIGFCVSVVPCLFYGTSMTPQFGVLAMIISVIVTYSVSIATKPMEKDFTDSFFGTAVEANSNKWAA